MVSGIILGGVLFHVDGENLGFGWISVKTNSDDNPRLPGRGLFFSGKTRPWNLGHPEGTQKAPRRRPGGIQEPRAIQTAFLS